MHTVRTVIQWLVIIAVIVVVWTVVVPRLTERREKGAQEQSAAGDPPCVRAAQNASGTWGNGLGRFVNPPYDLEAWSSFRADVDAEIDEAESACSCEDPSCFKVGEAMRDLRALVGELDSTIRNGSPPPFDIVQRQESIDRRIDEAAGVSD